MKLLNSNFEIDYRNGYERDARTSCTIDIVIDIFIDIIIETDIETDIATDIAKAIVGNFSILILK